MIGTQIFAGKVLEHFPVFYNNNVDNNDNCFYIILSGTPFKWAFVSLSS